MLKFLRSWFQSSHSAAVDQAGVAELAPAIPPERLSVGGSGFALAEHLDSSEGLPRLDWVAAVRWVEAISTPEQQASAWSQLELGWLAHLRSALGDGYRLEQRGQAVLLSSLDRNVADAALNYMTRTLGRICALLDGLADVPAWGHDILIVLDDDESYYRYASMYYPVEGEYSRSSGMYINDGCGHFVTIKYDLHAIETIIAHEMTHSCLSHLPLPTWLNEGVAVNTEYRLCPPPEPEFTPRQLHAKHRAFWDPDAIQEFWSGQSFQRIDDGHMLSYDLARIMVAQFAADWSGFKAFVSSANRDDAGQAAACEHLGASLGEIVAALLERPDSDSAEPAPECWNTGAA
jgi:hypothetical protein